MESVEISYEDLETRCVNLCRELGKRAEKIALDCKKTQDPKFNLREWELTVREYFDSLAVYEEAFKEGDDS